MAINRTQEKSNRLDAGKNKYGFLQVLLAFIIIALGIVGAMFFIKYKKTPQQTEQDVQIPLVNVEQVRLRDIPITVQGYGTVKPGVEIDIIPEVSGKVVSIHPELKVGGLIRKDEQILQIDPRDYELALMQAEAAVADATVLLETEQAEAEMARKEWEQLHPDSEPASTLVLREPQIRKAKATLDSAKAQRAVYKGQCWENRRHLCTDCQNSAKDGSGEGQIFGLQVCSTREETVVERRAKDPGADRESESSARPFFLAGILSLFHERTL